MTSRCSRRTVLGGIAAAGAAVSLPGSTRARRTAEAAQPEGSPLADRAEFESFLDGLLEGQLEAHEVPGATVAVVDGDETFTKGYGLADVAAERPVRADETLFRIGSVSKLFAWTAVMQGIERGRLDPAADVNDYLEGFAIPDTYDRPVTLDHLATHTAGFEERIHGTFVPDADDLEPLGTVLAEERPARVRPPGEFAAYSNYGAALAGYVAAATAGESWADHVASEVLDPLSMDRSSFAQPLPESLAADLAEGYTVSDGRFRAGEFEYVGIPPAGSMSATATDMARFVRAHLQGGAVDGERILGATATRAMHRRRFAHDDRLNGMAFGFYEMSRDGVRVVGHGGDTQLFHSLLFLVPEHDVGVFVSYNAPGGVQAREELLDEFLARYFPTDPAPVPDPDGAPARADDLEGAYRALRVPYTTSEKVFGAVATVDVSVADSGHLVTSGAGETKRWVEVDPLYFRAVDGSDELAFREADGELTHLFFGSRPPAAYEGLAATERPTVHATLAAVSLLVFLSAVVGWPAAAVWRRLRGRGRGSVASESDAAAEGSLRHARRVGWFAAASYIAFVLGVAWVLLTDPEAFLLGDRLGFRVLLLPPLAGAVTSVAALALAALAWRRGVWGTWRRVHFTLVALAGVVTAAILSYWNLLWYQM